MQIPKIYDHYLVHGFRWKTQRDQLLCPTEMHTGHLFNTLKMIWNHTMKDEYKFKPYRLYCFPPEYTEDYLVCAIVFISRELFSRNDLRVNQLQVLKQMSAIFKSDNKNISLLSVN